MEGQIWFNGTILRDQGETFEIKLPN